MELGSDRIDLTQIDKRGIRKLGDEQLKHLMGAVAGKLEADRQHNQILQYKPASKAAAKVHKSTAKLIGVSGGNGCLPLDAPVLMADGIWKPLDDVIVGDMVIGANPETGKASPAPVTRIWRSGRKPVYRVTFSDGGYFEATAEHMVPMYLGSGRKTTKGHPKQPLKRRLGDYLEPIMRRGASNPSKRISCVSPWDMRSHPYTHESNVPVPPYLLGALIGDGSLSRRSLKFHNTDSGVIERVDGHLRTLGCHLVKYDGCDFGITNIKVDKRPAGRPNRCLEEIKSLGLHGKTAHGKFIPVQCFGWNREARKELLAGLIDTDGTRDSYATASRQLAEDFEKLVRSLGGKAIIRPRESAAVVGGPTFSSWYVYWRMNERIPLTLTRKQAVNQRGREIDYRRRVCRSAELIGVRECGDIEVDDIDGAHCYVTRDYVIVSNSSKTETVLAEIVALATGVLPDSIRKDLLPKFRGPVNCRVIVESITTTLENIILPKLQWWKWTGTDRPGGQRGHWGWIPKESLVKGDWDRSWSARLRTLTLVCRDPETGKPMGHSSIQFMSHDQDPQTFASGDFHHVMLDEPPRLAIFRENQARTMRVNGTIYLAMTWPDDPSIPVDWIYDEIYDKGRPGPGKQPDIDWFELYTTDNVNLDQVAIAAQMDKWSETQKLVRIFGQPIRFSNRIHPLFTDAPQTWSFPAGEVIAPVDGKCPKTGSADIAEFCHVQEFEFNEGWPAVFLIDPHPRKPHMWLWVQVDPNDDWWVFAEGKLEQDAPEVSARVLEYEQTIGLHVAERIMDPNMGATPTAKRDVTWQDEFRNAKLFCGLGDDSAVGRQRINQRLRPDPVMRRPRLIFHRRCRDAIYQMQRYVWQDYRHAEERDQKQLPRDKYDDFPTLLKYLANADPTFRALRHGGGAIHMTGKRKGGY